MFRKDRNASPPLTPAPPSSGLPGLDVGALLRPYLAPILDRLLRMALIIGLTAGLLGGLVGALVVLAVR